MVEVFHMPLFHDMVMVIEYGIFLYKYTRGRSLIISAQMKNHKVCKRVEFLDSTSVLFFRFPKEIAQQTYPIIKFKQKELDVTFS